MNKRQAVKRAGSQAELARILGISKQAVCQWGDDLPRLQFYRLRDLRPTWFRAKRASGATA
jgi:DNA-binding XRE family transcriptional regulator